MGLRAHADALELVVLAVEGGLFLRPEAAEDLHAFVGAASARFRIDAAGPPFVGVFAADADAEDQPPLRELVEHGGLEGDRRRVAECEQVDAGLQFQLRRDGGDRREPHQGVAAGAVEGDVVADEDAIDTGGFGGDRVRGAAAGHEDLGHGHGHLGGAPRVWVVLLMRSGRGRRCRHRRAGRSRPRCSRAPAGPPRCARRVAAPGG